MIKVDKIRPRKDYICSFCGTGAAEYKIIYDDNRREAVVPVCEVCYNDLQLAVKPAPKKRTTKKADIE